MRDEVMGRAREMLAAEWAEAGFGEDAIGLLGGAQPEEQARLALRAIAKALSREEEIRAEERERCAHLCDEEADALDALPNPFRRWSVTQAKSRLARLLASAIRDGAPADDGWRPIESAPDDEPFMVGLWVTNNKTGQRWWESYIVSSDDETGEAQSWPEAEPLPWALQDFEGWRPLPPAPETGR